MFNTTSIGCKSDEIFSQVKINPGKKKSEGVAIQ